MYMYMLLMETIISTSTSTCIFMLGYVLYLESEVDRLTQENKELKANQAAMKPPSCHQGPKKQGQKSKGTQPKVPPVMKAVLGS